MGHEMATPWLTLFPSGTVISLSLFPLLCKSDQEIANLTIMVGSPSSQSILDLREQRVGRKNSSLDTLRALVYSVGINGYP